MNNKLKYFAYCRRSQDREDEQTLSIESQVRELSAYIKKHDLELVEMICEDESAYKRGRAEFNRMMEEIEAGKADTILVWHLTRLARNAADGGLILSFMDEGKIKEIRTPEKVYLNTPDDKFMMTIHFAMAKKSSDDTSSFVKNNVKTKLEHGEYPGAAHYGYLNLDRNGVISGKRFTNEKQALLESLGRELKRIEQDPIEAPLIRKLLDMALTGAYNLRQLQEEGFKIGLKGKNSGKMLAKQTVSTLLSDIFLTGRFEWKGEVFDGIHDPILTNAEFNRIQNILFSRSRPKKNKRDYTYQTLVYCPLCHKPMSGDFQKGNHYYRCCYAKGKQAICSNKKHIRQDDLDAEIEKTLLNLVIPKGVVEWGLRHLKEQYLQENKTLECKRVLLEQNLREEKSKLTRLTSKWLSPKNADGSLLTDEDYKMQKGVIQSALRNYEEQLTDVDGNEKGWLHRCEQFFIKLRNLPDEFNQKDVIGKKVLLQAIGARFVRKHEKWLVELDEPFSLILEAKTSFDLSEPQKSRIHKGKTAVSCTEMSSWLRGRDSNPQPLG